MSRDTLALREKRRATASSRAACPADTGHRACASFRVETTGKETSMPCSRENPCGGILYSDSQILELQRAGIPRRVEKCLAGHAYWEGEVPELTPERPTHVIREGSRRQRMIRRELTGDAGDAETALELSES
jgi:hypothetical protein